MALSGKRPRLEAAGIGTVLGLFNTAFTLAVVAGVQHVLPVNQWGKSAAAHLFHMGPISIFFLAVVFTPLFETLIGQLMPIECARRLRATKVVCIILGGAVFGLGHYLNGGILHGIASFFAGTVFSFGYVMQRSAGLGPAFIVSATAHAVHNATLLFVLAPLFPQFA